MEKQETKITKVIYSIQCPECNRIIKGTSPNSVDWNLKIHLQQKHNKEVKK